MILQYTSKIKTVKGGAAIVMGSLVLRLETLKFLCLKKTVDYIVATDAIGIGLNLKINNVSFSSLKKFDGKTGC